MLLKATKTLEDKRKTVFITLGVMLLWLLSLWFTLEILALIVGLSALWFFWQKPQWGVLAFLAVSTRLLPASLIDIRLPGIGGLDLADILFVSLAVMAFTRYFLAKTKPITTALSVFYILFIAWAAYSAFYALFYQNVAPNLALDEFRIVLYYASFFFITWQIKDQNAIKQLIIALAILADIMIGLAIAQQIFGAQSLVGQLLVTLEWTVYAQEGALGSRIIPQGHVLIYFVSVIAFAKLSFFSLSRRAWLFWLFQFLFLSTGLALSFTRAQWIASIIAVAFVALVALKRMKLDPVRFALIGFASIMILLAAFGITAQFNPNVNRLIEPIQERFSSIFAIQETTSSYSLQWRDFEHARAFESVLERPLLGVGLGNSYRELTTFQGEANGTFIRGIDGTDIYRFTRYMHNSYYFLAVKMGVFSLLLFIIISLSFLRLAFRSYLKETDANNKALIVAIAAGFIGLLFWVYFHSHLMEAESSSVISSMMAIVVSLAVLPKQSN